jgi:hypothetical protein
MKTEPKTCAAAQRLSRARRLEFVVTFVRLNLATLRPGDWLNLRDDLTAFLTGFRPAPDADPGRDDLVFAPGDVLARPFDPPTSDAFPPEAFAELQAEALQFLDDLIAVPGDASFKLSDPVRVQGGSLCLIADAQGRTQLVLEGTTRDLFFLVLGMLLKDEPWPAIVRCVACGTIFYRYKGQLYCKKACLNRVTQQRWRDRQASATLTQDDHTLVSCGSLGPAPDDQPAGATAPAVRQPLTSTNNVRRAPVR